MEGLGTKHNTKKREEVGIDRAKALIDYKYSQR